MKGGLQKEVHTYGTLFRDIRKLTQHLYQVYKLSIYKAARLNIRKTEEMHLLRLYGGRHHAHLNEASRGTASMGVAANAHSHP